MLTGDPAVNVMAVGSSRPGAHMFLSLAPTADTSRVTWIVVLGIICAAFAVCVIIVVRGKRADPQIERTSTQKLRIQRARSSLWVLAAFSASPSPE
jgi:hypothetical protein